MRNRLVCSTMLGGAIIAGACNRAEVNESARDAAGEVKRAAATAGDALRDGLRDGWLTTKIQAQYFADADVKARHINVSTRDGVVTLRGSVETAAEREQAVQIARNTDGARRVDDQLQNRSAVLAEPGAVPTRGQASSPAPDVVVDDAQLTARVQARYYVDDRMSRTRVHVDSRDGVVTLAGEVVSEDERAHALRLAHETPGVTRVEDHLTLSAPAAPATGEGVAPDDEIVTTTIQARFFVDNEVKNSAITVTAKDGIVLLDGTVPTNAARARALSIARNTAGVLQVVDKLTVSPAARRP